MTGLLASLACVVLRAQVRVRPYSTKLILSILRVIFGLIRPEAHTWCTWCVLIIGTKSVRKPPAGAQDLGRIQERARRHILGARVLQQRTARRGMAPAHLM